ncbi:hypothetical protein EMCRGX_G005000 [Ephydatia muelleri]
MFCFVLHVLTVGCQLVRLASGPTPAEGRMELYYNGSYGSICQIGWNLVDATVVCKSLGYAAALVAMGGAATVLEQEASMDGGVTLSVMSSGKCICRTGSPSSPHLIPHLIPTPHPTPHPHTSSPHLIPHLIPTLHPHTSFPHLIPTPHPHTSSPHLIPTPHPHTSSPHLIPTPHPHTSSPHLIPTPHPHTSSPHLIPTPHPHTSSPHLIPTPHPHTSSPHLTPHTSSPHLIPTPHPHTSSPHLLPTPSPHLISTQDAQVICCQLGFSGTSVAFSNAYFGAGSSNQPIWLDGVNCLGTETNVGQCLSGGWGIHNCVHMEDAGVRCSGRQFIRLASGPTPAEGRVELYYNGSPYDQKG